MGGREEKAVKEMEGKGRRTKGKQEREGVWVARERKERRLFQMLSQLIIFYDTIYDIEMHNLC